MFGWFHGGVGGLVLELSFGDEYLREPGFDSPGFEQGFPGLLLAGEGADIAKGSFIFVRRPHGDVHPIYFSISLVFHNGLLSACFPKGVLSVRSSSAAPDYSGLLSRFHFPEARIKS